MQVIHREGAPLRGQGVKRLAGAGHLFLAQTVAQGHVRHVREGGRTRTEHPNKIPVNPLEFGLARLQVQVLHLGHRAEGVHRPPASLETRGAQVFGKPRGTHGIQQGVIQLRHVHGHVGAH